MGKSIERITIKGFKSIRALEDFELRPLNLMIGANGAGKTNFISVFRLLNQIANRDLSYYVAKEGGASRLLYFGPKITQEILIDLTFGKNGYQCKLSRAGEDALIFANETTSYQRKKYSLGRGHSETNLHLRSRTNISEVLSDLREGKELNTVEEHVLAALTDWRVYHFHDTSPSASMKLTVDINDNRVLRSDAANLAAFLYMLKETRPDYYKRITNTIRLVAPFFNDFALQPNPLNPNTIILRWRERGAETDFSADVLSDGTLRFICLATLLLQPELPATILIDEPELGLHPYAITLLASLLKSTAVHTQVIVSTQSVTLINQFQPEDIIVVDREDGQSKFTRHTQVDLDHWLDEYGMGDLWEKNVLGGRP